MDARNITDAAEIVITRTRQLRASPPPWSACPPIASAAACQPSDRQAVHGGGALAQSVAHLVRRPCVAARGRRLLSGGPGSHPPRCTGKCGSCNPCYPVHVSVPPGVLVTTEYYPEAWRCKCRNQLYMP
ncbi:hypothetical protein PR202_gb01564 [Eleusine coracana subsp. coracana]|uniref:Epidermal patterning factor-like protein n=1 Tax=Eleusine coracana subsp. coracana TaxID=191504 RepID=A0AAV5DVG5_ELECO|nr:hypothetical protein PR202_gb01564 [Eleusine coracana subsp. coracana]